ncbi:PREDICTED: uncharacterized protein LOC109487036 isoform X1 [Branchiostoma belcheri]|uniref:Uncharacterized protein LOC109487036 isoform X1 n=1 Tax=Branchiostoma belcheri TaxID=7741 RepID=A0A6P4ZZK7_BRABE|nr:PREDICTED: uncharacterized protein LOC109487036 isoform X1 [Branchiostoma belcheri]
MAAEVTDMSSEEKLEEMRQELERLVKLLRASIDSKTAGFKRINKEWNEALKELRRAFKKADKFHKRYRKTMSRLEKMGYIIPPAPQPQEAPHRRASLDAVTPSAETRTSDMSLVMELRRAASSLYQIQTADGVSGSGETADKLPAAEGRTPSLPTVPEPTAVSSEENLEEMRQELERLVKLMRASIDSKTAGFKRINKEWGEALKELRRAFKKAEKFHKRYRKTMAHLEKMGYIIPPAPQPQEAIHRRRASVDVTTSSAETCTSDTSLVIELRRAVSSLYGIQSVDGVSAMSTDTDKQRSTAAERASTMSADRVLAMSTDTDKQRSTAAEGASTMSADRVSAMSDDIDRLSFATGRENPPFYDDPDNLWLTWPWMFTKSRSGAKDDSMHSDTTSLSSTDSFATAVSELMDLDDHHGESTAHEQASEVILQSSASTQKKSKLQRLKKWIQRKGRSFCNKIRCR